MPPNAFHTSATHERRRPPAPPSDARALGTVEDARGAGAVSHRAARAAATRASDEHRGHHALGQQQDHEDQRERHRRAAQHRLWPPVKA